MVESLISFTASRRKSLALAVIVAAQFMVVLDIAIVNVALPDIKGNLHFAEENLRGDRIARGAVVAAVRALVV